MDLRAPRKPLGPEIKTREPLGIVGMLTVRVWVKKRGKEKGSSSRGSSAALRQVEFSDQRSAFSVGAYAKAFCWT